ncbi:MAG: aromatic acid decarboxylase [gamma proteobacterium symbiont of Ctena orbiculata]|uniref:Flavin prenyltransferase UbiX n=1 Tax=Candidatus Thiodiazotropha taylori TaxID=2792791 RepID=A0A944MBQ7_9GAMM|nr:UbiX family flavin prenyltransferase [Candidatus Thiodiazotropha taylori]PUB84109.1 MAG: aromatic acid decarboxylase [gamma proteobacterium symbiont of Ctena orbiculata]MBT2988973.1 UbiX family flavin prenyltransferase [Candidatus Thiodiazotropha taylori]MBT2996381.1 UbiX family flavin prenyltransferase [Candidatus Thiodiazotropha taylori]MBT3000185.1 UbiX family flavin prenyltransferase [Candidatus Thiodiazotropha taylori]
MKQKQAPIAVAITGASGSAYALRLLESLLASGRDIYLMISQAGQIVLKMESDLDLPGQPAEMEKRLTQRFQARPGQLQVFGRQQWMAPVASGSNPPSAMVVCPCTTGTLAAIACGASNDLIERAADVVLKERRKLILVVRETPFSAIHLENMLKLSRMGAIIMPANPGFYHNPATLDEIVDFMVARILDQLDIEHSLMPRWGATTT